MKFLLKRLFGKARRSLVVVTFGPDNGESPYVFGVSPTELDAGAAVYRNMVEAMRPQVLKKRPVEMTLFWYTAFEASMRAVCEGKVDAANVGLCYLASALRRGAWCDGDIVDITFGRTGHVWGKLLNRNDPKRRSGYHFGNIDDEARLRQSLGF